MKRSVFKPIIAGILIGAAIYFVPFFALKTLFFILIIGAIFRMFSWRRYHWRSHYYVAYADKIRSMSEEEYNEFKNKMNRWNQDYCCNSHYSCGDHYSCWGNKENQSPEKESK
jgi:hypothetical protein